MTTVAHQSPEIIIAPFTGDRADMESIAAAHLAVRYKQREDGENFRQWKADITDSQADLTAIDTYYLASGGNFFVAIDRVVNRLAGFVGIRKESEEVCELKRMAVLPEYRRRRLGYTLGQTAVNWATREGFELMRLTTGLGEHARAHIYEPLGFRVVDFDEDLQDFYMELKLR